VNCQQAEKLLPLYAGGDLDQKRERLIAAHVKSCASCAVEVDEFRTTARLFQELARPPIREDAYDEIRRNVWRKIEADSAVRHVPRLFIDWFQPRAAWAAAAIVIIAITLTAAYLISNKRLTPQNSVAKIAGDGERSTNPQPSGNPLDHQRENPVKLTAGRHQRQGLRRIRNFGQRVPANAERDSLVANASVVSSVTVRSPGEEDGSDPTTDSQLKDIRVEIQTSNPNIRIIWLSHPETKRPTAKGI